MNKIKKSIVCIWFLLFVSPTIVSAAPPIEELQKYVLEIPTYDVPDTSALDLKSELEQAVLEIVDTPTRFAPAYINPGRVMNTVLFADPSEYYYTFALAYPYVSDEIKSKIITYIQQDAQQYNSFTDNYPMDQGQSRIPFENGDLTSPHISTREIHERLYNIWLSAEATGEWNIIENNWNNGGNSIVTQVHAQIDPNDYYSLIGGSDSVNRNTAALIAFTRSANHVVQQQGHVPCISSDCSGPNAVSGKDHCSEFCWGLDGASKGLAARIDFVDNNRPEPGEWRGWGSGGKFILESGGSRATIPRYRDLTPEIGKALKDYKWQDMVLQDEYINVTRPGWFIAWGERFFGGEIYSHLPDFHTTPVFKAKFMIMQESPENLRLYIDTPWCKGDLYYIQKLVYTINASGDTSISTPTPIFTPSPQSRADVNGDKIVNLADIQGIIFYWGQPCTGSEPACTADVNDDTQISLADISGVIFYWGQTIP